MNANKPPYIQETGSTRSYSMYPGLGPGGAPYGGQMQMYESQLPATIQPHQAVPVQPPAGSGGGGFLGNLFGGGGGGGGAAGGGGGGGLGGILGNLGGAFSNFKITDIKNMVDRMGGIDGVMSTVGKVQKIMTTVKQMSPMIKLLFAKTSDDDDDSIKRRKRRRKRRRRTTSKPLNKVGTAKKKRPRPTKR